MDHDVVFWFGPEYGQQHSIDMRYRTITEVVDPFLEQGLFPESSEGFDQVMITPS